MGVPEIASLVNVDPSGVIDPDHGGAYPNNQKCFKQNVGPLPIR